MENHSKFLARALYWSEGNKEFRRQNQLWDWRLSACPYPVLSEAWECWRTGWLSGMEEARGERYSDTPDENGDVPF